MANFENPTAIEIIGFDLASSVYSQSLIEEPEVEETPIQPDRTR